MRKHQKKKILELLQTIRQAQSAGLYADCQEGAFKIGEFIEQVAGDEGTRIVALLEEYCELLYKASKGEIGRKQLRNHLVRIENSIRDDLKPNKIEVAFFPYKASMFDSFESVWLAAKEDPSCDAYVVPIPYYELRPNGLFGKMNCDDKNYPDYVPVLDWREYDIEERRPDVIVIHNPYDDGNLVTSVHPDFYSERLKRFTDLLVYVPYFVSVDDVPEHLCTCAGVLNADRVIVQSEKIRNTYVRVFKEFEKAHNCKGRFGKAETKFAALGSPKFDKVLSSSRENQEIPDEWRELIENPDGTRKKIVLYNTSIGALLADNEKMLKKLGYVFDCFREREDVVLWWRPHPLNGATYGSMRPGLARAYAEIVAEYKRGGFGIYDDTADLHRAIAVSDAYYGDWSSLVALYGVTGKPVMIQNADVYGDDSSWRNLVFRDMHDDGEHFWFTAAGFSGLFRMNKRTWKAEYMGSFPGENQAGLWLYGGVAEHGGSLYFAPVSENSIATYDPRSGRFRKIRFDAPQIRAGLVYRDSLKFFAAESYGPWMFFVGATYPAIMGYDTETETIRYFSDWVEPLDRLVKNPAGLYFLRGVTANGPLLVAASANANAVLMFDMETCVSRVYEVGSKGSDYSGICFDGNDYWLAPSCDGPIVRWNPDMGKHKEYADFPDGFAGGVPGFLNIRYSNGFVWLFPARANMALKIDVRDGKITETKEFRPERGHGGVENAATSNMKCIMSKAIGDTLYAHTGRSLIEYDAKTGRRRDEPVVLTDEAAEAMERIRENPFGWEDDFNGTAKDRILRENAFFPLERLLDHLPDAHGPNRIEPCGKEPPYPDGGAGAAIYAACKREAMQI
jgi:streptogramin lyase